MLPSCALVKKFYYAAAMIVKFFLWAIPYTMAMNVSNNCKNQ